MGASALLGSVLDGLLLAAVDAFVALFALVVFALVLPPATFLFSIGAGPLRETVEEQAVSNTAIIKLKGK